MSRILLLSLLLAPIVASASVVAMPRARLAAEADAIVIGTVTDAGYEETGRGGPSVVTHHALYVERVIAGDVETGDLLDVRTAGGRMRVGNRTLMELVPEAPALVEGDHVVLFLYALTDPRDLHLTDAEREELPDAWAVMGWRQGALHIDDLSGTIAETGEPTRAVVSSLQSLNYQE